MKTQLQQMYTGESVSFNVFEHNSYLVKRISPYTYELYSLTQNSNTEVYQSCFAWNELNKLVEILEDDNQ